jgi:hypothetical protein
MDILETVPMGTPLYFTGDPTATPWTDSLKRETNLP